MDPVLERKAECLISNDEVFLMHISSLSDDSLVGLFLNLMHTYDSSFCDMCFFLEKREEE
jgi:hypothetical protein